MRIYRLTVSMEKFKPINSTIEGSTENEATVEARFRDFCKLPDELLSNDSVYAWIRISKETTGHCCSFFQKFNDRSELFNGIVKYRDAFLEAEPQTFVVPNHWDADVLFYVANGQGTITLIEGDSRQSHNIMRGELFYVSMGITAYLINNDNNGRLVL
ncbi:putative rmlC-like cupin domain superfamily, rmlC-like jelly roll protein [Helianthus debilis subsp. tardiflorus]